MSQKSEASETWYPTLYRNEEHPDRPYLFGDHPKDSIEPPQVLLSITLPGESIRHFRLFDSYDALNDFLITIPKKKQHFFECIFGDWRQKPHFDFDKIEDLTLEAKIKKIEETVKEEIENRQEAKEEIERRTIALLARTSKRLETIASQVREEIAHQLSLLGIKPNELRWYSSNSDIKKSLHLLIPHYYFDDKNGAKKLCQYLIEKVPDNFRLYFDLSVYSKLQNFRVLGSHKPKKKASDTRRVKTLMTSWVFQGEEITTEEKNEFDLLKESLVSCVSVNAKPFPAFSVKEAEKPSRDEPEEIEDSVMRTINDVALEWLGPNFRFYRYNGNIIAYLRMSPSECAICSPHKPESDREHEGDHPYVSVVVIRDIYHVYFHCPRAKIYVRNPRNRSILIAKLIENTDEVVEKEKKKQIQTTEWSEEIKDK